MTNHESFVPDTDTLVTKDAYDAGYDVYAGHFASSPAPIDQVTYMYGAMDMPVGSARMLEIGSGDGRDAKAMSEAGMFSSYVGVEPSATGVTMANGLHIPNARFVEGFAQDLPVKDGEFQTGISINSILHVPKHDLGRMALEVARALDYDGTFYIKTKVEPTYNQETYHDKFERGEGKPDLVVDRVFHHHSVDDIVGAAREAGLTVIDFDQQKVETKPWDWGNFIVQK